MSRSSKKGLYVCPKILKKITKIKAGDNTLIKIWARASTISPEMIGYKFGVYNGKIFIPVQVTEDMVGHKFGEFSLTKKFVKHGGKAQKALEQKKNKKE